MRWPLISPANGSGKMAFISPSSATAIPPPSLRSAAAAVSISASLVPATIKLCESCATVEATAPRFNLSPCTKPSPTLPVAWWRSNTASFKISREVSLTALPLMHKGFSKRASVKICSGTMRITLIFLSASAIIFSLLLSKSLMFVPAAAGLR